MRLFVFRTIGQHDLIFFVSLENVFRFPLTDSKFDYHQGSNKKFGFLADDNTDFIPTTDVEDFEAATRPSRQDSREVLRVAQARDPFVGTEVWSTLSSR